MAIVQITAIKRRRYGVEKHWFPLLEELGHRRLRGALIDAGVNPQTAGGIVWFIDDQLALDRHQTESSRNRYRDALASLEPAKIRALANRSIPGQFKSMARAAAA